MCVFVLQTLSTEPNFGKRLNKNFEGQDYLPASIRLNDFAGTYADFLIIVKSSVHRENIMLTSVVYTHAYYYE